MKSKYEMSVEELAEFEGNSIGSVHEFPDGKIKLDWISGLMGAESNFGNYYVGGRVIESDNPDLLDAQVLATHCNNWNQMKKNKWGITNMFKPDLLIERVGIIAKNMARRVAKGC